ncbi:maleylpyruvate isomerase family mycothiol-dependent enzyme [Nocardioides jensenii]|uniref:maleylpyruvate isomerase family mycothiol-dependent enzyme n=1 Tax=Nocardioides jensenii TaxID=1843 RepID=UPI00082E4A1A|nr:maleylpyruvate isomerase family mycothiol-dependent enzyme [Nocardioides jensenii]
MATELTQAQHLEGLRAALVAFTRYADRAGLRASVPTTPDWTVRKLVVHQGMVHRWAAALVRGDPAEPERYEREGQAAIDPLDWLRDGAIEVVTAISVAADDLAAPVFLNDAPPAREFWARRQCHETTIHAVDALSAALGRYPKAADTWISDEVALDGIDELLTGFLTRERSRLRSPDPMTIAVRPEGTELGWEVAVSTNPAVTRRTSHPHGDVELTGSPVSLYLALWNRSDEIPAPELWQDAAVTW